jgi:hypothetical protein
MLLRVVSVHWGVLILVRGHHIAHYQYLFLPMTSAPPFFVNLTPYALVYEGVFTRIPTPNEYAAVADLTGTFLKDFMFTSLANLIDFRTESSMIIDSFSVGEPLQVDYLSIGLFNPESSIPTVGMLSGFIESAIDARAIDDAFRDDSDSLTAYVILLQNLPSGNIFSSTFGVNSFLLED